MVSHRLTRHVEDAPSLGLLNLTGAVTAPSQGKALLEQLKRVPNPMPAKLLVDFMRRLLELQLKAKGK